MKQNLYIKLPVEHSSTCDSRTNLNYVIQQKIYRWSNDLPRLRMSALSDLFFLYLCRVIPFINLFCIT